MKAFVLACSYEKKGKQITSEQILEEVKILFDKGMFGKTSILVDEAEYLKKLLQTYLHDDCGMHTFSLCSAKEFYEKDTQSKKLFNS